MKTFILTAVAVGLISVGCAQARVLDVAGVVGPAPEKQAASNTGPIGTLMVYSAFETNSLGASPFDDIRPHTAYQVYSKTGELLRKVENTEGGLDEGPTAVKLSPGVYRVVARANGHGVVSVLVRVDDHRTTSVHLDGDTPAEAGRTNVVRLPGGEVIGASASE